MIDLPVGKALVAVGTTAPGVSEKCCSCVFYEGMDAEGVVCHHPFLCRGASRKDGRNVIFRLVDYPAEEEA